MVRPLLKKRRVRLSQLCIIFPKLNHQLSHNTYSGARRETMEKAKSMLWETLPMWKWETEKRQPSLTMYLPNWSYIITKWSERSWAKEIWHVLILSNLGKYSARSVLQGVLFGFSEAWIGLEWRWARDLLFGVCIYFWCVIETPCDQRMRTNHLNAFLPMLLSAQQAVYPIC